MEPFDPKVVHADPYAEIERLQSDKKALAFQLDQTIANLSRNEVEIERLRGLLSEMRTTEAMTELQAEKMKMAQEIERLRADNSSLTGALFKARNYIAGERTLRTMLRT